MKLFGYSLLFLLLLPLIQYAVLEDDSIQLVGTLETIQPLLPIKTSQESSIMRTQPPLTPQEEIQANDILDSLSNLNQEVGKLITSFYNTPNLTTYDPLKTAMQNFKKELLQEIKNERARTAGEKLFKENFLKTYGDTYYAKRLDSTAETILTLLKEYTQQDVGRALVKPQNLDAILQKNIDLFNLSLSITTDSKDKILEAILFNYLDLLQEVSSFKSFAQAVPEIKPQQMLHDFLELINDNDTFEKLRKSAIYTDTRNFLETLNQDYPQTAKEIPQPREEPKKTHYSRLNTTDGELNVIKKYIIFLILFFVSYQYAAFQQPIEKIIVALINALQSINTEFIEQEKRMTKAERIDKYQTLLKTTQKELDEKNEQIGNLRQQFNQKMEKERNDAAENFVKNFFTENPKKNYQDLRTLLNAVSAEFIAADSQNKTMFINKSFEELLSSFSFKLKQKFGTSAPKQVIEQFVKNKSEIARQYKPSVLYTIYIQKKYQPFDEKKAALYAGREPKDVNKFLEEIAPYLDTEIKEKFLAQADIQKLMQEQKELIYRRNLWIEKLKDLGEGVSSQPTGGTAGTISHTDTLQAILKRIEEEEEAKKRAHETPGEGEGVNPEEWEEDGDGQEGA